MNDPAQNLPVIDVAAADSLDTAVVQMLDEAGNALPGSSVVSSATSESAEPTPLINPTFTSPEVVGLAAVPSSEPTPINIPPAASITSPGELPEAMPAPSLGPLPESPVVSIPAATPPAPLPTPVTSPASAVVEPASTTASSILEILRTAGDLSEQDANQVELEHIQTGVPYEKILEEKNVVSEEALTKAKSTFYKVPFVRLEEIGVSPEALTQLPEGVARRYGMFPFTLSKQDRTLSVAMKDPLDLLAIDFAEQKSGYNLIVHYAMPSELERLIAERYAQSLSSEVTQALKETNQVQETKKQLDNLAALSGEVVRQAPITKIVETILAFAMKARASDIHIEPQPSRTRVRYRIDGLLTEKLILPKSVHEAVVSRVKILSDLKIDEKRVPQDGRFTFISGSDEVDLRVSTLPTIHGEKIVMRLLKKNSTVPSLNDLGLEGLALRKLEDSIRVPHGIVLVTGPTGSGKTTTLYSVLHKINTPKVNIMTLEDPVEYQMAGINQVQINPQAGLTFASGLRSFLRQDPNVIMVGEIRDSETVELAVQASLTGHLVFSTLHTSSAAGALPRLVDMGAEPFLLASSITLTMAQRIVRTINNDYKEEYKPEQAVVEDIKQVLGDRLDQWCKQNNKDPNNFTLFRCKSDRPQTEPEYRGRVGIYEVMKVNEEISRLIMENKSAAELEKAAVKDKMLLMKQDGYLKALQGLTTIEEVLRVAQV
ncbi:MAG TPA: ATPase, T2SS/T4P/T4SS family [Vitreimonas sp.]|nr:ATPase, T2SS/T4P/T4SS family [Vitreimonas sp.]